MYANGMNKIYPFLERYLHEPPSETIKTKHL